MEQKTLPLMQNLLDGETSEVYRNVARYTLELKIVFHNIQVRI